MCSCSFSAQGGLAPDGRCKSFADAADGTGWSEGVGVAVVERLADAQPARSPGAGGGARQRDQSGRRQQRVDGPQRSLAAAGDRQALAHAGLSPGEVDAVEAHGTGTTLGDPIEAQALLASYGQDRERPLWLGLDQVEHRPHPGGCRHRGRDQDGDGDAPSRAAAHAARGPALEPRGLVAGSVALLTGADPWEDTRAPRRAGVSSFGISGTNAHVILEESPDSKASAVAVPDREPSAPGAVAAEHDHELSASGAVAAERDHELSASGALLLRTSPWYRGRFLLSMRRRGRFPPSGTARHARSHGCSRAAVAVPSVLRLRGCGSTSSPTHSWPWMISGCRLRVVRC